MPELPEVETVARLIRGPLVGRRIEGASIAWERTLGGASPRAFRAAVKGRRVARVWRRAKYIVADLEQRGRASGHLLIHLRMTGRLVVESRGVAPGPYARVSLLLAAERGKPAASLHFLDVRKFGRFELVEDLGERLAGLGPEPLSEDFSPEWLVQALRRRRRMLKPLLLDQAFLAGLGNIYVDEALFRSGLHPLRLSCRVPRDRARRLHGEIRATLAEAIEREGSSFDAFYRTPEGQPGSYQHQFRVYGRDGQPCRTCARTIVKLVVGQRGTHICTRCQPAPR